MTQRMRKVKTCAIVASKDEAFDSMANAARKHLWRPNEPLDQYYHWEACLAWARKQTDKMLANGDIIIKA